MNRKTKRLLIIIASCFLLFWGCEEFLRRVIGGFGGSYPFVEYWDINATEAEVIDAILELKKEDPSLQPPNETELISVRDTGYKWTSDEMIAYKEKLKTDSLTPLPEKNYNNYYHDYWLFVNFYYADTKEIVRTWTRPDTKNVTTFAFISVGGKLINKDFWYIANKREIHKFKKLLVDRIQAKIDKKKTSP